MSDAAKIVKLQDRVAVLEAELLIERLWNGRKIELAYVYTCRICGDTVDLVRELKRGILGVHQAQGDAPSAAERFQNEYLGEFYTPDEETGA